MIASHTITYQHADGREKPRLMLDICSGLGGASAAMRERGWRVVTLDTDPVFSPDIVADVRDWSWPGARPDLIWCSPPCTEFARESMPWSRRGIQPDMSIVEACRRIIVECRPRYWVIENVRGALPYLGKPTATIGAFYLWGDFPDIGRPKLTTRKKEAFSSQQQAKRARIPYAISRALAIAVESQLPLWEAP